MNKDFTELVKLIKSGGFGDALGDKSAPIAPRAPGTPRKPGEISSGPTTSSSTAVKQMQIAMQELAQAVTRDAESATMFRKPQDANQGTASEPVKSAKKSFNDFMAENFMGDLPDEQTGVEWTKDPRANTHPTKAPGQTDIYELDVVMDTMRRVGAAKSELQADGIWGRITNNALRNMLGFSYALLQLEGELGLTNDNLYTTRDWQGFTKALLGYDLVNNRVNLPDAEKAKRATAISVYLKKIAKLYDHFRIQVTSSPTYRPYIEGNRGFFNYSQTGSNPDTLNPEEESYSQLGSPRISNLSYYTRQGDKKGTYIPLKSLSSKEEYLKWMSDLGVTSEPLAVKILNQAIKPQIDKMTGERQYATPPAGRV